MGGTFTVGLPLPPVPLGAPAPSVPTRARKSWAPSYVLQPCWRTLRQPPTSFFSLPRAVLQGPLGLETAGAPSSHASLG